MSKCGGADFRNATLDSADLRWADLRGACLRAAGLNDANLAESNGAEALTPNYDADGRLGRASTKRAIDLSGAPAPRARKSAGEGKGVSGRVAFGGRRYIKKKK